MRWEEIRVKDIVGTNKLIAMTYLVRGVLLRSIEGIEREEFSN